MKKQMLLLLLILICFENYGQEYLNINVRGPEFNYTPISNNQHQFHFSIGILDYYIPTMSSTIEVVNDTLEVKMFYDITQQVVNVSNLNIYNNNVFYNEVLPANVTHIKMSVNVILIEDNPPFNIITVESLYYTIINLNNLANHSTFLSDVAIAPNPTAGTFLINALQKLDQIKIFDLLGHQIFSIRPTETMTKINLDQCKAGVYLVQLTLNHHQIIQKLVVH